MKTYTKLSQLPHDPELWGDREYRFFWEREARKRGKADLKVRIAVIRLLRRAGEPFTPASWDFLVPMLKDHMPIQGKASKDDPAAILRIALAAVLSKGGPMGLKLLTKRQLLDLYNGYPVTATPGEFLAGHGNWGLPEPTFRAVQTIAGAYMAA